MRLFGFLGTVATLAIGMYIYSLQVKAIDPSAGGSNGQEAALTADSQVADSIPVTQYEMRLDRL